MNAIYLLSRNFRVKNAIFKGNKIKVRLSSTNSSDEKQTPKIEKNNANKKKNEDALKKLNSLLKTMIEEDVVPSKSNLELAKPVNRRKKDIKEDVESVKVESKEKQMVQVVKKVAEAIGGDTKQTESELLIKLLSTSEPKPTVNNLKDIVQGMKIDHDVQTNEQSRAQQIRQILTQQAKIGESKQEQKKFRPRFPKPRLEGPLEKIDLFGSEPLGIFTDISSDATEGVKNNTWTALYQRDLRLAVTHPPSNYFQQMIIWTEQGKVWKFPIDNEQGLEEEKEIYFTEHVFLEKHLEPWCPQKGPIRHFMELVCVGLSKNPYLTVDAKKEHIAWFRKYFEGKKQLLREVGALQGSEVDKISCGQKQIE